jgi:hypothetical protein
MPANDDISAQLAYSITSKSPEDVLSGCRSALSRNTDRYWRSMGENLSSYEDAKFFLRCWICCYSRIPVPGHSEPIVEKLGWQEEYARWSDGATGTQFDVRAGIEKKVSETKERLEGFDSLDSLERREEGLLSSIANRDMLIKIGGCSDLWIQEKMGYDDVLLELESAIKTRQRLEDCLSIWEGWLRSEPGDT